MSLTAKEIRAMYDAVLAHATTSKDSYGNGNSPAELPNIAYQGLRSEVHAALQEAAPCPHDHPDDEGDPDLCHARQKAHGKGLWKQADAIIEAAGITAKGAA